MHQLSTPLALTALLCVGCSSVPSSPSAPSVTDVVDLHAAGEHTFLWQGRTYSVQDLGAMLAERDQAHSIERINLYGQRTTIADAIDVAVIAKSLGAQPFLEKDGHLQPITLEISE